MTVVNCQYCGRLACVCDVLVKHRPGCRFRQAVTGPVAIECDHGYDACPLCDSCDCDATATTAAPASMGGQSHVEGDPS